MIAKGITGIVCLTAAFIAILALFGDIINASESARTDPATDSGLICTTGAAETSCQLTLTDEHQYAYTDQMTVLEISPGTQDRTAESTIDPVGRVTVTVASLATSTPYTFDVTYAVLAAGVSEGMGNMLGFMPVLLPMVLIASVLLGVAAMLGIFRSKKG